MKSAPFTGTYQATSILQGHAGVNGSNGVPHGREISSDMARLREIVCRATDCSTGSDELLALSADPYTRFHLSPERANVLRPLRSLLQGEVLQLGAEAGAWTRFLGECGGQVCAVEADATWAEIAALRCQDLRNVRILANRNDLPAVGYDVIVITGDMLARYFPEAGPLESVLSVLKRFLKPSGILIAAFENSLALNTMAAVLEQTDGPGGDGNPSRRSRLELEQALSGAGFEHAQFFYPFPGFEAARLVLTPRALAEHPELGGMITGYTAKQSGGHNGAMGGTVWGRVLENGLLPYLSNSFLVLASARAVAATGHEILYIYSTARRKHFSRQAILRLQNGQFTVVRSRLFPDADPPPQSLYRERDYEEPFFTGYWYVIPLQRMLESGPWHPSAVARWARPWLDLLEANSSNESVLPPTFVDCIPINILTGPDGTLHPFDFEYHAAAPISLKFVAFRGLFHSLSAVIAPVPPVAPFSSAVLDLVMEIMQIAGLPLAPGELDEYVGIEAALQHTVTGVAEDEIRVALRQKKLHMAGPPAVTASAGSGYTVQVFWRAGTQAHSEERAVSVSGRISRECHTIVAVLPPIRPSPDVLRLDPCDRAGVFCIYGLRLFDGPGKCLWAWDGDGAQLFDSAKDITLTGTTADGSGTLAVSRSDDPSFDLPAGPEVLRGLSTGGRLELDLAWPAAVQPEPARVTRSRQSPAVAELERECGRLNGLYRDVQRQADGLLNANAELERERARLEGANSELHVELRSSRRQVERLAGRVVEAERDHAAAYELNRQLQAQLREARELFARVAHERDTLRSKLDMMPNDFEQNEIDRAPLGQAELIDRLDRVEAGIAGIYQSRIWRTFVAFSSPLTGLHRWFRR